MPNTRDTKCKSSIYDKQKKTIQMLNEVSFWERSQKRNGITIKEMALFPPQGKKRIRQDEEMFALWHSHFETEVRHMVKIVNECLFSQCL